MSLAYMLVIYLLAITFIPCNVFGMLFFFFFFFGEVKSFICLLHENKIGGGRTTGKLASCSDFSVVGMGQPAVRQELGPRSNVAMATGPKAGYWSTVWHAFYVRELNSEGQTSLPTRFGYEKALP